MTKSKKRGRAPRAADVRLHAGTMGKVGGRQKSAAKTIAARTNAKRLRSPAGLRALAIAREHGAKPGEQHKAWVIDQMVKALTGVFYDEWVRRAGAWDQGVAPSAS